MPFGKSRTLADVGVEDPAQEEARPLQPPAGKAFSGPFKLDKIIIR